MGSFLSTQVVYITNNTNSDIYISMPKGNKLHTLILLTKNHSSHVILNGKETNVTLHFGQQPVLKSDEKIDSNVNNNFELRITEHEMAKLIETNDVRYLMKANKKYIINSNDNIIEID